MIQIKECPKCQDFTYSDNAEECPECKTNFNDPLMKDELTRSPNFSNIADVVYLGHTVTYAMLQIAVIMGCNLIYLLGVDNRYNLPMVDKVKGTWQTETSSNHFHSEYGVASDKKREFHIPNKKESEMFFDYAADWAGSNGIKIYNATPGTALQSFKKVDFNDII